MLTRRVFLASSITLTGMFTAAGSSAAALKFILERSVRVAVSTNCADGAAFMCRFPGPVDRIDSDPMDYMLMLGDDLRNRRISALIGLCRDSDFILLRQQVLEAGYRFVYHGQHLYQDSNLIHEVRGNDVIVAELPDQLRRARAHWPEALADYAAEMTQSSGIEQSCRIDVPLPCRPRRGIHLNSWAFVRT